MPRTSPRQEIFRIRGRRRATTRVIAAVMLVSVASAGSPAHSAVGLGSPLSPTSSAELVARGWIWPAASFRLARPFVAPAHEYAPGHRGIDLELVSGAAVRAPADGVIAFSGSVAGRGILTIDHGGGLVTTFEPVHSELVGGSAVRRGEDVATLGAGGHAEAGHLHFGVRLHGAYINPLLLLGGVPRAVLLPCCE